MCFIKTKESKLLIAKRDIIVYKVGIYADVQMFTPYFMTDYCYRRKALANQTITFNKNYINIGLHSVLSLKEILRDGFILMIYFQRKEINMSGLLSMIGMQTELDYLIGDFPACFGSTPLAIPKGNISSDKQKYQPKVQHEFTIKSWQLLRKMPSKSLIIVKSKAYET